MAKTNFDALTTDHKLVWSRDIWGIARNASFVMKFAGKGSNAMVQRVTELTKDERGDKAVITLVPDVAGDGVSGDFTLEGNEAEIKAYDLKITIDQLRQAHRTTGRMTDQKTVVNFRETARDQLGYWLADRIDQMAFLALSGVAFTAKNNGAARPVLGGGNTGLNLSELAFAADVSAPTAARHRRWNSAAGTLDAGNTAVVAAIDLPSYKMLVKAKAFAKDQYIKGIKGPGGQEFYHVFMTPTGVANLKLDSDYKTAVVQGADRGKDNPFFSGSVQTIDGLIIHEYRHVYNTSGLANASKWGIGGLVDGQRVLFCGAQALAMADLGNMGYEEETFDYENQSGISISKIFGLKKPKFHSPINGDVQDFGVLVIDCAL